MIEKLQQLEPRCEGENEEQGGPEGGGRGSPDGGGVGTPFTASVLVTPTGCCWAGGLGPRQGQAHTCRKSLCTTDP